MVTISEFPDEIVELIFGNLDARAYWRAGNVCQRWYQLTRSLAKRKGLWEVFCRKEIPEYILEEHFSLNPAPLLDAIDWKIVYERWYVGRWIGIWPFCEKQINADNKNPVTCLKISGSFIITGHRNGFLCTWSCDTRTLRQKVRLHFKTITDFALIDFHNAGYYSGFEELLWSHHHAITISKDGCIHVVSLLEKLDALTSDTVLRSHSKGLELIRVFGKKFAVSCEDNTISVWAMSLTENFLSLNVSQLQCIIGPTDAFLTMGLWKDEVQCLTCHGCLKVLPPGNNNLTLWQEIKHHVSSYSETSTHEMKSVTRAFVFRYRILIMFTDDGGMLISLNGEKCTNYHLMQTLQTLISAVAFRNTTLALGGENGKLYLFNVAISSDLLELNLSKPSFVTYLSASPIISIDISHNQFPVLVASSCDNIFAINWSPPKRQSP